MQYAIEGAMVPYAETDLLVLYLSEMGTPAKLGRGA